MSSTAAQVELNKVHSLVRQVVCREVGLGYVQSALQTHLFTNATAGDNVSAAVDPYLTQPLLAGVSCLGNEESLYECGHDADVFCPGGGDRDVAAVVCVDVQADLEPNTYELMTSAHLEDKQLFFLQVGTKTIHTKGHESCLANVFLFRAITSIDLAFKPFLGPTARQTQ